MNLDGTNPNADPNEPKSEFGEYRGYLQSMFRPAPQPPQLPIDNLKNSESESSESESSESKIESSPFGVYYSSYNCIPPQQQQQQSTTVSNLFGTNSNPTQPSGSLFSVSTAASGSSFLFDSTENTTTQRPAGGFSLTATQTIPFTGTQCTAPAPPPPPQNGLFGAGHYLAVLSQLHLMPIQVCL